MPEPGNVLISQTRNLTSRFSAPFSRLQTKLTLVLFLLLFTMVIVFVFFSARAFESEERTGLELKAVALASLLGESIGNSFYEPGRVDQMRVYLSNVRGKPQVIYAYAFDVEGKILGDGTRENLNSGKILADQFQARAVATDTSLLQYRYDAFRRPENILDVTEPIFQPTGEKIGGVRIGFTLQPVQQRIARFYQFGLLLGALLVVAGGILLARVSRILARPIEDLVRGTQRIASGSLDVMIPIRSNDELGTLAASFNEMAVRLKENQAKLERKVIETTTLYEVGQEIAAQVAHAPTLRLIVDRARRLLDGDLSLLALRERSGDQFTVQAYSGEVTEALAALRFRAGQGVGGRVAATGRPMIVGDYRAELPDSPFAEIVDETHIRSQVAVPLTVHGVILGVLYVSSRIPHRFGEEDQVLLAALGDQAAIAIENARLYEDVRRHAEDLETKVEVRTRELQEANRRLEGASQHKSQFLANMSHELRTPLNAILGYTELVLDQIYGPVPERIDEVLRRVQHSARHLLGLINDILDLSKIEAGELRLSLNDYSMAEVVQTAVTAVEALAAEKQLMLKVSVSPDLPPGRGDDRRITQVLLNLVGNAIKFTEAGEINVAVRASDGEFLVSVRDTGPGIAAADQRKIFEEFHQVDSSSTRSKGGTGLGLSIARQIIDLHGGRMWVESDVGEGSTFSFSLPVRVERQQSAS
jgi:signal transduction histidine kinase